MKINKLIKLIANKRKNFIINGSPYVLQAKYIIDTTISLFFYNGDEVIWINNNNYDNYKIGENSVQVS